MESVERTYASPDGGTLVALSDVTLDLHGGETLAVLGPSGSGKSTLLALAGLMDAPTGGRVLHKGRELAEAGEREREHERLTGIGFVFQHFYLVPTLTAERNVALPLKAAGRPEPMREARDILKQVGLAHRREHYAHQLSGGEQQLVAVARALANRPYLLLADEPTGELDADAAARVLSLLQGAVEEGAALALVTHDPAIVPAGARTLRLQKGRPVVEAPA